MVWRRLSLAGRQVASIELSCKVLDESHKLHSTLLHELCHAVRVWPRT